MTVLDAFYNLLIPGPFLTWVWLESVDLFVDSGLLPFILWRYVDLKM